MRVKFCWKEGQEERCTEQELPTNLSADEILTHLFAQMRKAYKYSDEPLPEGLLNEGESRAAL